MTRTLLAAAVAAVVACACVASAAAAATVPTVCIINTSTKVTDAQIQNALPAIQAAVDQDFAPVWNQAATVIDVPTGQTPPAGCWQITLMDTLDLWAYGYHDTGPGDTPYAHVEADPDWTIILTHELFEMLADPRIDRYGGAHIKGSFATKLYLLEVCDPVEDDSLAYTRPGADGTPVQISDFVTERWYDGEGGGLLDFGGHLTHAHTVAKGGYMWTLDGGCWREIIASRRSRPNDLTYPPGSVCQ